MIKKALILKHTYRKLKPCFCNYKVTTYSIKIIAITVTVSITVRDNGDSLLNTLNICFRFHFVTTLLLIERSSGQFFKLCDPIFVPKKTVLLSQTGAAVCRYHLPLNQERC